MPDAQHMIGRGLLGTDSAVEIRDHPTIAVADVDGAKIHRGPHERILTVEVLTFEQTGVDALRDCQRSQRRGDVAGRAVIGEKEQSDENAQVPEFSGGAAHGHRLTSTESSVNFGT